MSRPASEPSRASFAPRAAAAAIGVITLCFPMVARADEPPHELRHDLRVDVPLAIGLVGTAATLTATEGLFGPSHCRWCDEDDQGNDTLNPLDRSVRDALVRRDPAFAARVSDIFGLALVPISMLGLTTLAAVDERSIDKTPVDLLIVAESVGLATTATQITKFVAGRQRPYVHALAPDQRDPNDAAKDRYFSFFSGHSSFTFALATSAGTVSSLRGYRLAPFVWGVGLTLAATTGYLRIAADKHYFTDVLTGALVGAACGVTVPLLHGRQSVAVGAEEVRGGSMLTVGGAF